MSIRHASVTGIARRNVRSRWIRLLLTVVAVASGVAFFTGSSIVSQSLSAGFTNLFRQFNEGVDFQVRAERTFGSELDGRGTIPLALRADIEGLDGVSRVEPILFREAAVLDGDGVVAPAAGPSALIAVPADPLPGVEVRSGRTPTGAGEAVIDTRTARLLGVQAGEGYVTIRSDGGTRRLAVVGTIAQSGADDYLGAVIVGVAPDHAADIAGTPGQVDGLAVVLDEYHPAELFLARVAPLLPAGVEAAPSAVVVDEQLSVLNRFLGPFSTVLVGFSFVALFVAAFIVTNTFSIGLSQRLREVAMLAAIGARSSQLAALMLVEALLLGLASSTLGLVGGLAVARAIVSILSAAGGFPEIDLVISPGTAALAILVGLITTVVASLRPAMRAARTAPLRALTDAAADRRPTGVLPHLGLLAGAALFTVGILHDGSTVTRVVGAALGAAVFFLCVPATASNLVGPLAGLVVRLKWSSAVVRLGAANAARNPRRTSAAAAAMIVGLGLVAAVTVVGTSIGRTLTISFDDHIAGTHVARPANQGPGGLPESYVEDLRDSGSFGYVVGLRRSAVQIGSEVVRVTAADHEGFTDAFRFELTEGDRDISRSGSALVEAARAADLGLELGDSFTVSHIGGTDEQWTVAGVFVDPGLLLSDLVVSKTTMETDGTTERSDRIVVAGGAATALVGMAPDLQGRYPDVVLEDLETFRKGRSAQIDRLLGVVNALLGMTVAVAAIGVANTLSLTVLERGREIGLLRAVGATRRQIKRMVRLEAMFIGLVGGLVGVLVGACAGSLLTKALPDAVAGRLVLPFGRMTLLTVAGIMTAWLASWWPARRAAGKDVLDAIAVD